MPELPEVETLARGLQREISGRRVLSVELGKTDFMDNPADVERELPGTRIERVERYGHQQVPTLAAQNGRVPGGNAGRCWRTSAER